MFSFLRKNKNNIDGEWRTVAELKVGQSIAVPKDWVIGMHKAGKLAGVSRSQGEMQSQDGDDVLWDEIESIEYMGTEQVWDIEVEGTHNFVGNNIFAHNTYITGNLGVATSSPFTQLGIGGSAVGSTLLGLDALSGQTAPIVDVKLASTSKFVIDSSGNLGVGTSTPWAQLSVNPNALGSGVPEFAIGSSTSTHFVVTGSGNVGIGTASPGMPLEVATPAVAASAMSDLYNIRLKNNSVGPTGGVQNIEWLVGATRRSYMGWNEASNLFDINSVLNGGAIRLLTNNTERVRIDNSGNVGIGTTNPTAQLQVQSTNFSGSPIFMVGDRTAGSSATAIYFDKNTSSTSPVNIQGTAVGVGAANIAMQAEGGNVGIGTTTPPSLLTIGTTPSQLVSTNPLFLLGTSTLVSASSAGTYIGINAPTGFTGNFLDFQKSGASQFKVSNAGSVTASNFVMLGNGLKIDSVNSGLFEPQIELTLDGNGWPQMTFAVGNSNALSIKPEAFQGGTTFTSINPTRSTTNSFLFNMAGADNMINGVDNLMLLTDNVAPTSGTLQRNTLNVQGTYNQSGNSSGITRGIYVSPTVTKAYDFRAFEIAPYTFNMDISTTTLQTVLDNATTYASTTATTLTNAFQSQITGAPIASTNVTISTSTALAILGGAVNGGGTVTNAFGLQVFAPTGATNNYAAVFMNGNVGVSTTTPWRTFAVTGTVGFDGLTAGAGAGALCLSANKEVTYSAGATCTVSSARYKNNIATSTVGLSVVKVMRPVTFDYNADIGVAGQQFGFIAEEVEKIDPRLVVHDKDGLIQSVRYENYTAVLTTAVQELDLKVSDIDTRLTKLEALVASGTPITTSGTGTFAGISVSDVVNYFAGLGARFENGIAYLKSVFVDGLTVGSRAKPTGITLYDEVTGDAYCMKMRNGAMVSLAGACDSLSAGTATTTPIATGTTTPITTATTTGATLVDTSIPVITIVGNNPAVIQVGTPYVDLGATVTDTNADGTVNNNLGLHFKVDGVDMMDVQLDTSTTTNQSATTTHTIIYSATDGAGNTGHATRTVEVVR